MSTSVIHENQWGGFKIKKGPKGFILDGWSNMQGQQTGYKFRCEYGTGLFSKDIDLNAQWNECIEVAYALAAAIMEMISTNDADRSQGIPITHPFVKILKRGVRVQ